MAPTPSPPPPPNSGTDPVPGSYTLTLDLGSGCQALPDVARTRTYTATIETRGEASYVVTLSGGTFLDGLICTFTGGLYAGLGCNQFLASHEGDLVRFNLVNNNDDAHGAHIVEQVPPGTWLEIIGTASGRLEGTTILEATTIEASGSNSVWYCPVASGYPFPCSSFIGCASNDMRLTFRRR